MTTIQHATLDTSALSHAIEARDADGVVAAYADDAVLTLLDRDHPPSAPQTLRGVAAIADFYREVCGRNVEHRVSGLVTDGATLAYEERCRYPKGGQVVCVTVAQLTEGRITTQTVVQTWDD